MEHHKEPHKDKELPKELLSLVEKVMHSPYVSAIQKQVNEIKGRVVESTVGGTSGYLLTLRDGSFVIIHLSGDKMDIHSGRGTPREEEMALINSKDCGDASGPLAVNLPYADESCSISHEVSQCRGMAIEGVSLGENTFNLCFPEGWELDASIVPDPKGKKALRVFWEQW
jgi:hypothetical protein